jgi:hypothetical protein
MKISGFKYLYARKLRRAMQEDGQFMILYDEQYISRTSGEPGIEYICTHRGRVFFLSESKTHDPSPVKRFVHVLRDDGNIKEKPIIWPNRRGEEGLYLEVTYLNRWYKFHTPIRKGPEDEFAAIAAEVFKCKSE